MTGWTHPNALPGQTVVPHPTDIPLAVVAALHRKTGVDLLDDSTSGAGLYACLAYYVRHLEDPSVTYAEVLNTTRRRDVFCLPPSVNDDDPESPDPTAPPASPGSPTPLPE